MTSSEKLLNNVITANYPLYSNLNYTPIIMKFNSKEIEIENNEFGYTLTFNENETHYKSEMNKSAKELMHSTQKYILLQRTYPEDEFEKDYYYFEPSDFDKACELKNFVIDLYRTSFELTLNGDSYQVQFREDGHKFEQIKQALEKISNGTGILIIHDAAD